VLAPSDHRRFGLVLLFGAFVIALLPESPD
jgi:hypothetical protein